MMPVTHFNELKNSQKITEICKKCGKKRTRTISESQTINPWNTNKDGSVKSRQEVWESVKSKLKIKVKKFKEHFICKSCEDGLNFDERRKWFNLR